MKAKIVKMGLFFATLPILIFSQSCMTNVARTNARLESGLSGNLVGMYAYTSKDSRQNENQKRVPLEGDIQYAFTSENNSGFAMQVKLGFGAIPSLDFYYEIPSGKKLFYGVGIELGQNSGYFVTTYYPTDGFFMTVTGRAGYFDEGIFYNPQLAFGFDTDSVISPISLFVGYNYFGNRGLDLSFWGEGSDPGYVKKVVYGGLLLGF